MDIKMSDLEQKYGKIEQKGNNEKEASKKLATIKKDKKQQLETNTIIRIDQENKLRNLYVIKEEPEKEEIAILTPNASRRHKKPASSTNDDVEKDEKMALLDYQNEKFMIQCKHCKKIFKSKSQFEDHVQNQHLSETNTKLATFKSN